MPNLNFPIPDLEATVERQVAVAVAKQLCLCMDMVEQPIVVFNGQHMERPTSGSKDQENINRNELNGYSNVFITYEEEEAEGSLTSSYGFYRPNEMYLFNDEEIGVRVFTNYVQTIGRIQFRYQGVDRNRATQFNTIMRSKYFQLHQEYLVEPEYNYFIPNEVLFGLLIAHQMKKLVTNTTETDSVYLSKRLIKPIYVKKRSDGQVDRLYKREIQSSVFGTLDPEVKVYPEKESDNSKVTIAYTFEFSYHKPVNVRLVMPVMIGQKTLPEKLRKLNKPYEPERKPDRYKFSSYENRLFRSIPAINSNDNWIKRTMLRSPNWDEFDDPNVKDYMLPLLSILCQINKEERKTIITLKTIKTRFRFNEKVYTYMEDCGKDLLSINRCAIIISVFYNDTRMSDELFEWDEDNQAIVSKEPLDLLKIYRVVVSLNYNMANELFDWDKFIEHGESSKIILETLYPDIKDNTNYELITDNGHLVYDEVDKVLEKHSKAKDYLRRHTCSSLSASVLNLLEKK